MPSASSSRAGWSDPELALLVALSLPTLVAFLLGLVIARVTGVAHAMLTLAVGQAFYEVVFRWRELAKGDDGMSFDLPARMFGLSSRGLQDPAVMVVLAWCRSGRRRSSALAFFARSRIGQVTAAIRDNEERARFHRLFDDAAARARLCDRGLHRRGRRRPAGDLQRLHRAADVPLDLSRATR